MRFALIACFALGCSVPEGHYIGFTDGVDHDVALDGQNLTNTLSAMPPGGLDFGDVVVNFTSAANSVTVVNTGSQTTGALAITFTDQLGFALVADTCSGKTLAPAHTCTFSVTFTPQTATTVSTSLAITASPGGEVDKPLSGTGISPGIVDIVETTHDFGSASLDGAPVTHDFMVRNTGQGTIGAPVAGITGDPNDYKFVSTCSSPLGPTDTCTVTVSFHPKSVGQLGASLGVTSSMGGGSDAANLVGTGTAHVKVTLNGGGLVSSSQPGINCGVSCDADFSSSPVTLTAQAGLGYTFSGWGNDCTGSGSCPLTLDSSKNVIANFDVKTFSLGVIKVGLGTVTALGGSIDCGTQCSNTYDYGTVVTLTAAASGGAFAGWSGDCSGSAQCVVTVDKARAVTATFTTVTQTLTVMKAGTGTGTVTSSPAAINCGTTCSGVFGDTSTVTLTAMPDNGFTLASWSGCTSFTSTTCTVIMASAENVTATFSPGLYGLDVTTQGSGAVSSSDGNIACGAACSHAYAFGTPVSLTAAPTNGAVFSHWSGGECDLSPATTCAFSMPANAVAVKAIFVYKLVVATSGNGTGSVASNPGLINCGTTCTDGYDTGTVVMLTATATGGSSFGGWSGDCTGLANPCSVTMSQARNVVASFSSGSQTLTTVISANGGTGTITSAPVGIACPGTCSGSFALSSMVTLTAAATGGSTFEGWTGDCTGVANPCVVTMSQARTVTGVFSKGAQTLVVTTTGTGTVTSAPAGINCGASCTAMFSLGAVVTLHPATGTFTGWSGDCTNATGDCTVTMDRARNVAAAFTTTTARLTITDAGSGSGSVTPTPVGTPCGVRCWDYTTGTSVTLAATADPGSELGGWSTCAGTSTCLVVMSADVSETATFVIDYTLSVSLAGDGTGSVTGNGGIACSSGSMTGCSATYASTPVTTVNLVAAAGSGSVFTGWGGACASSGTGATCSVPMTQASSVTATFLKYYKLTTATTGGGSISQVVTSGSAGPSCGAACIEYISGSIVQLTAVAGPMIAFSSWSGDCAGQGTTCTLTMSADKTATANFLALQQLTVEPVSNGTVSSTDSNINCGLACTHAYPAGTMVTLNAAANPDAVFFGWSGACTGSGACVVTMDQARDVTATFYLDLNLGASVGGVAAASATNPPGIACAPSGGFSSCIAYASGTQVTVTATASTGYSFASWANDCSGTGACSVTMSVTHGVTANFSVNKYPVTVTVTGTVPGQGSVQSMPAAINCGSGSTAGCMAMFDFNSQVTLNAVPDMTAGRFVKWNTGPCAGMTTPSCTFVMPASTVSAVAVFDYFATMTIRMNGATTNRLDSQVSSGGAGLINCTNTTTLAGSCSANFTRNQFVTLTYSGTGQRISNWQTCNLTKAVHIAPSGDCQTGTGTFGSPPVAKCMITFTMPGAYTSEADVTCQ